jgi:hypothetical protein
LHFGCILVAFSLRLRWFDFLGATLAARSPSGNCAATPAASLGERRHRRLARLGITS